MRKFAATTAVILMLSSLTACREDAGVCEPGVIRQDHQDSAVWWVCNQDGTREDRITGPGLPDPNHTD